MSLPLDLPTASPSGTTDTLLAVLERYWGYTSFRPLQREAMEAIAGRPRFAGGDAHRRLASRSASRPRRWSATGVALVVSPLISLMKDQVDTLVGNGVSAACYNSALSSEQKQDGHGRACARAASACSTSRPSGWSARAPTSSSAASPREPRRCASWPSTRPTASASGATTSGRSTGSSAGCATLFPGVSLHAFTATATGRVRRDIVAQLGLRDPLELVGSFDRPNLVYRVLPRIDAEEADPRRRRRGTAARPASSTASRAGRSMSSPPGCRRRACGRCRTTPG